MSRALSFLSCLFTTVFLLLFVLGLATSFDAAFADEPLDNNGNCLSGTDNCPEITDDGTCLGGEGDLIDCLGDDCFCFPGPDPEDPDEEIWLCKQV